MKRMHGICFYYCYKMIPKIGLCASRNLFSWKSSENDCKEWKKEERHSQCKILAKCASVKWNANIFLNIRPQHSSHCFCFIRFLLFSSYALSRFALLCTMWYHKILINSIFLFTFVCKNRFVRPMKKWFHIENVWKDLRFFFLYSHQIFLLHKPSKPIN